MTERLRYSKKNISLPELWCILQSLNEHCSLSMSKVIQMLEGDIDITTFSFQMASICSSMALANCFALEVQMIDTTSIETAKTSN